MRQLKKYGLCMLLAAILLLTAACGRNNTNNGTTADDNMAGTTEDSNQTNENVDINDILFDTDGDGIPDEWEKKHNLNPNDPSDGAKYTLSPEYTNLEMYMNSLVNHLYPKK